jgi:hypothetical protein
MKRGGALVVGLTVMVCTLLAACGEDETGSRAGTTIETLGTTTITQVATSTESAPSTGPSSVERREAQPFVDSLCEATETWATTPGPDDIEADDPEGPPRAVAARGLAAALDEARAALAVPPAELSSTSQEAAQVLRDSADEYRSIAQVYEGHPESNAEGELYEELVNRHYAAEEGAVMAVGRVLGAASEQGADISGCPLDILLGVPV